MSRGHGLLVVVQIAVLRRCFSLFVDDSGATIQRSPHGLPEGRWRFPTVPHIERVGERAQLFGVEFLDRRVRGVAFRRGFL